MAAEHPLDLTPLPGLDSSYTPSYRPEVKQHWHLTFARQTRLSVYGKRVLARVFSQLRDDDDRLRDFYQVRLADILQGPAVAASTAYAKIKPALRELAGVQWEVERLDRQGWVRHYLLDVNQERRVSYHNGLITLVLNPQLAPYLIRPAHYSRFPLHGYLPLKSWYSMRLFEILAAWQDKGYWEVTVEEYRRYLDCWHEYDERGEVVRDAQGQPALKYATTRLLLANTLQEPLKELKGTDYEFTCTPIYETTRASSGRRRIIRFRFELVKGRPLTEVPASWLKDVTLERLVQKLREWQVSDYNIAKYAPVLNVSGVRQLLRAWDEKNRSTRHIDSKVSYCNAAFVRAGKQALEEAQQQKVAEQREAKLIVQQALSRPGTQ